MSLKGNGNYDACQEMKIKAIPASCNKVLGIPLSFFSRVWKNGTFQNDGIMFIKNT